MSVVMDFLARIAIHGIRSYRSSISPHKGFTCAYRLHWGGASCSGFAETAIRKCGVWRGFLLLRRRLRLCAHSHDLIRAGHLLRRRTTHQAGFCDDVGGLCGYLAIEAVINGCVYNASSCRAPFARTKERHSGDDARNADAAQGDHPSEDQKIP